LLALRGRATTTTYTSYLKNKSIFYLTMNHALNRLTQFFLQKQEVCPEPRTDVVPSICLTSLLAVVVGYIWISSIYALLNSDNSTNTIEENVEVKEEPTSSEDSESSTNTDKSDTEEHN
jgi:hypothetical protein